MSGLTRLVAGDEDGVLSAESAPSPMLCWTAPRGPLWRGERMPCCSEEVPCPGDGVGSSVSEIGSGSSESERHGVKIRKSDVLPSLKRRQPLVK